MYTTDNTRPEDTTLWTVAEALGWDVKVVPVGNRADGTSLGHRIGVTFGGRVVTFRADRGDVAEGFCGEGPNQANAYLDADRILRQPCTATSVNQDAAAIVRWRLPGFPTPEDAKMRVGMGQHEHWKTVERLDDYYCMV